MQPRPTAAELLAIVAEVIERDLTPTLAGPAQHQARVGDPMEDLAWPCQRMWRFRADTRMVGGLGSLDSLRGAYRAAGGTWDEQRFRWWRVLGTVRWGLGLARQARGHLDGSFPSIVMAGSGRRVPELEYDTLLLVRQRL